MCRPYPVRLSSFFYLIANIVRAHVASLFTGAGLLRWAHKKGDNLANESVRAHRKMSQEIKTPSIVNLHNELGARFPSSIFRYVYV